MYHENCADQTQLHTHTQSHLVYIYMLSSYAYIYVYSCGRLCEYVAQIEGCFEKIAKYTLNEYSKVCQLQDWESGSWKRNLQQKNNLERI